MGRKRYGEPDIARAVIDELGGTEKFKSLTDYSEARISQFRSNGLPIWLEKYLRLKHPDLKAWSAKA